MNTNENKNPNVAVVISPNWKDYAKKYLPECIDSLRKQTYEGKLKFYLADNETSTESFAYLSQIIPEAELVLNKGNEGFAKGNNDCIKLALAEDHDYIFLINMDTITAPDCIEELVETAQKNEKIGAIQARLMLHPEKNLVNSLGNSTHFLGFGFCLGYKEKVNPAELKQVDIMYPTGAAVMFRASVLKEIGLFDEKMWMYNEDQDLGWRTWLAGYRCVLSPQAVVYHKYEFAKSIKQYYFMDRNRIISMLRNYHLLTLLLILPAFVVMEFGLIIFSIKGGWFKEKLKVWTFFLNPVNWIYIIRVRKESQIVRKIKDKEIIHLFSGKISHQEVDDIKLKLINPVFNLYWAVLKKIARW